MESVIERAAFHSADPAGVFNRFLRQAGVFGKRDLRIGAFETRKLERRDFEIARALATVFDAIGEFTFDVGQARAENGIVEILGQRHAALGLIRRPHDEHGFRRHLTREFCEHNQTATLLDARIARCHRHFATHEGENRHPRRRRLIQREQHDHEQRQGRGAAKLGAL